MAPNHLLLSWLGAATLLRHRRERILVAYSGLAPDLDGLGWLIDQYTQNATHYYAAFHHKAGHGILAALLIAGAVGCLARCQPIKAALCAFAIVHLHILCDMAGSRGADGYQWPIYYFYPFLPAHEYVWAGQWDINAWQNRLILFASLVVAAWCFIARRVCFFEVFGRRFEQAAFKMLRPLVGKIASKLAPK